jgi:hypothetical protein
MPRRFLRHWNARGLSVVVFCCRRTADVRSVGYSELFSLSREDVLAAMKDYPEAQEILQTLGRKRLMEARSINRGNKNLGKNTYIYYLHT